MSQLALWATRDPVTVHCFFGGCKFLVVSPDPDHCHAVMESHYKNNHVRDFTRLVEKGLL